MGTLGKHLSGWMQQGGARKFVFTPPHDALFEDLIPLCFVPEPKGCLGGERFSLSATRLSSAESAAR